MPSQLKRKFTTDEGPHARFLESCRHGADVAPPPQKPCSRNAREHNFGDFHSARQIAAAERMEQEDEANQGLVN